VFSLGSIDPPTTDTWRSLPSGCMRLRRLYGPCQQARHRQCPWCTSCSCAVYGPTCNSGLLRGPWCNLAA
jgi:hypothetical protein